MIIYMLSLINLLHAENNIFQHQWKGDVTPQAIICQDSKLDKELVKDSIEFIIERYNIKFPETIPVNYGECPDVITRDYKNYIFFKDFQQDDRYAYTNAKFVKKSDGIKYLENTTVFFPNDITIGLKREILRHEIGHALGLAHNDYDYVMYP